MINIPKVKLGVVAVSRDCFPIDLSERRRAALIQALAARGVEAVEIQATVENELDAKKALEELAQKECNALVMYLGNFGPEGPETLVAQHFDGPVMFCGGGRRGYRRCLASSRGDAYCGLLNASYNLGTPRRKGLYSGRARRHCRSELRRCDPGRISCRWHVLLIRGEKAQNLRLSARVPTDFVACNAPIASRCLTWAWKSRKTASWICLRGFNAHENDPRIPEVVKDMEAELGDGNKMPEILPKLAQYEITLLDWVRKQPRHERIRGHRGQMLAGVPGSVRLCALLCQLPL